MNTNYERFVEPYQNIFECVDPSNLAVQGNDDTLSGQTIIIDLVKCKGKDVQCKSEDEVKEFFEG